MLALFAWGAWRAEVACRLRRGLTGIEHFHWALPLGVGAFIAWAVGVNRTLPWDRRVWLGIFLALVSGLCLLLAGSTMANLYKGGTLFFDKSWVNRLKDVTALVWLVFVPAFYAGIAEITGPGITWRRLALSEVLFVGAVTPCFVTEDLVEAIRSGLVIPPVVVALGILFCRPGKRRPEPPT